MNEPAKPPRPRPVPVPDPETAPYWEGANEGRLLVQRCTRHGHHQLYPRPHCVVCRGPVEWRDASGRATVYSFTVIRQNMARPFRDLIYPCDWGNIRKREKPGMRVRRMSGKYKFLHS